ncbi:MAG: FtsQ-type POTRA domain-containing protein [Balneolaceae bacterium]
MTKQKPNSNKKSISTPGWAAFAVLMLGLAALAGFYFEQNTRISSVDFEGHVFTQEQHLVDAFDSPVGILADSVSYSSIYSSVNALPYVKKTDVRMSFRGTLTIAVEERQPIGMLADKPVSFFDEDGIVLPAVAGHWVDVPVVYGFKAPAAGDTLQTSGFTQVREFLKSVKTDPLSWSTVSEVAWNEDQGVVALSSENGVKLVFGRDDFEQKVTHWKAFYQDVVAHKGIDSFRSVDLRFRNQIVADEL